MQKVPAGLFIQNGDKPDFDTTSVKPFDQGGFSESELRTHRVVYTLPHIYPILQKSSVAMYKLSFVTENYICLHGVDSDVLQHC